MKKLAKFSVFPVLIILISLFVFGCSDSGDDGPGAGLFGSNPALGEEISLSNIQAYDWSEENTDYTFTKYAIGDSPSSRYPLTGISNSSVAIINSKLSLTLGTPGASAPGFVSATNYELTAEPEAKILRVAYFLAGDDSRGLYYLQDENHFCFFVYAEKDTRVTGTTTDDDTYDLNLKEGWNMVLAIGNGAGQVYKTGAPDASYIWEVVSDPE
jgi:hypothetical protein